jgi:hypothetical protein
VTAPRSKRTPSTTRALDQWRLEAIKYRDLCHSQKEIMDTARHTALRATVGMIVHDEQTRALYGALMAIVGFLTISEDKP